MHDDDMPVVKLECIIIDIHKTTPAISVEAKKNFEAGL
jgi:hypothetical protein